MPNVHGKVTERYTMFDWLKRCFGKGTIYFDFVCDDGSSGRGKSPYIGDPNTFDKDEFIIQMNAEIWHKYAKRVIQITNIRIL